MAVNKINCNLTRGLTVGGAIALSTGTVAAVVGGVIFAAWFFPQASIGVIGSAYIGPPVLAIGLLVDGVGLVLLLLSCKRKKIQANESGEEGSTHSTTKPSQKEEEEISNSVSKEESKWEDSEELGEDKPAPLKVTMNLEFTVENKDIEKETDDTSSEEESSLSSSSVGNRKLKPLDISSMSDEILLYMFSYLSARDLVACRSVEKRWRQLGEDNSLWKPICFLNNIPMSKKKSPLESFSSEMTFNSVLSKIHNEEIQPRLIAISKLNKLINPNNTYPFENFRAGKYLIFVVGNEVKIQNLKNPEAIISSESIEWKERPGDSVLYAIVDKSHLAITRGKNIKIIDLNDGSLSAEIKKDKIVALTANEDEIYIGTKDGKIAKWDWKKDITTPILTQKTRIRALWVENDIICVAFDNGRVRIRDLSNKNSKVIGATIVPGWHSIIKRRGNFLCIHQCRAEIDHFDMNIHSVRTSNRVMIFDIQNFYLKTTYFPKMEDILDFECLENRYLVFSSKFQGIEIFDMKKKKKTNIYCDAPGQRLMVLGSSLIGYETRKHMVGFAHVNLIDYKEKTTTLLLNAWRMSKSRDFSGSNFDGHILTRFVGNQMEIWDLKSPIYNKPKKSLFSKYRAIKK